MGTYLHPGILTRSVRAPHTAVILGGRLVCSAAEAIEWRPGTARVSHWHDADRIDWPDAFTIPRAAPFDRPRLMGILNVTPDSFSDGGTYAAPEQAIEHGLRLARRVRTSSTSAASRPGRERPRCRSRRSCGE
jgi:hypothetical protein